MVACAAYRHVDLVAAATGERLVRLPFPGWANCCCAAAGQLVAVGDDGHVRCWSVAEGGGFEEKDGEELAAELAGLGDVMCCALGTNGAGGASPRLAVGYIPRSHTFITIILQPLMCIYQPAA